MTDSVNSLSAFSLTLTKTYSGMSLLSNASTLSSGDDTAAGRRKHLRRARRKSSIKRSNFRWQSVGSTTTSFASHPISMPSRKRSNPNLLGEKSDLPTEHLRDLGLTIPRRKRSNPNLFIDEEEPTTCPQEQQPQCLAMPLRQKSNPSLMDIAMEDDSSRRHNPGRPPADRKSTPLMNATLALKSLPRTPTSKESFRFVEELVSFPAPTPLRPTTTPKKIGSGIVAPMAARNESFMDLSGFSSARTN